MALAIKQSDEICEKVKVFIRKRPSTLEDNSNTHSFTPTSKNKNNLDGKAIEIDGSVDINDDSNQSITNDRNQSAVVFSSSGICTYRVLRSSNRKGNKYSIFDGNGTNSITQDKIFKFDGTFDQHRSQEDIFDTVAKPLVDSVIEGYSATIMAYGSTGSGKTHTMRGPLQFDTNLSTRGIMPRCMEYLLSYSKNNRIELWMSYLQIYCEVITDLLSNTSNESCLHIREKEDGKVFVDGLSRIQIDSIKEFEEILIRGDEERKTAATNINETSSRSHAICIIAVKRSSTTESNDNMATESTLVLVDLAGSERAEASDGRNYQRFEEAKAINLSLSSLGNCITALVDGKKHIPYRDSKLTRLLQSSLAGESRLSIIATISSGSDENGEILNTLRFASRSSKVLITAHVSRIVDYEKLYEQAQRMIEDLKQQIQQQDTQLKENSKLLDNKNSEMEDLRERLSTLEARLLNENALSSLVVSFPSHTDGSAMVDSNIWEEKYKLLKKQQDDEIKDIRTKYELKITELKNNIKEVSNSESIVKADLTAEKQRHLSTLQSLRLMQENFIKEENESIARKQELLIDLQSKQEEIDNLNEQLLSLASYAKRTTDALETAESSMSNMISVSQVKEMESLFMETVTKLSERVKQLELPRMQSKESNKESGSAVPLTPGQLSRTNNLTESTSRTSRIEPGGRIRR